MYGATNIQTKFQNFSGEVLGHLGIIQIFFRKTALYFTLTAPQTCVYERATCHVTLFGRGTGRDMGHLSMVRIPQEKASMMPTRPSFASKCCVIQLQATDMQRVAYSGD